MANDESHYGRPSCKSAAASTMASPWKQQQSLALWGLNNYSALGHVARLGGDKVGQRAFRDEDLDSTRGHLPDDLENESGLELCLGLSLGGSLCKAKSKSGMKEEGESDEGGKEKAKEEDSPRRPVSRDHVELPRRRVREGRISGTQAFWQEFVVPPKCLKEEIVSPLDWDAVRERQAQSHSGSSTVGLISMHLKFGETWSLTKDPTGEECKAAFAHQFWQTVQENASQVDKTDAKEEKCLLNDPLRVSTKANAASRWDRVGKGGGVMQLLDRLKYAEDGDSKCTVYSTGKKNPGASFSVHASGSLSTIPASGNIMTESLHFAEGGPVPPQQSTSLGKGEVSSQVESYKAAAEQQQIHIQETMEQQKKQRRQEARKKRKAFLEEQKLQKKVKKEDDCRFCSGQSAKLVLESTRPGTPASGSKGSSTGPLSATAREASIGTREVSSPPDSQDGESTNSGLRRTGSAVWQHGSLRDSNLREGPSASAPGKSSDNAGIFNENDEVKQLREIRRALQRERDRAAMDKGKELEKEKLTESRPGDHERRSPGDVDHLHKRKEEPTKLHAVGDLASHDPSGAISASSVNRPDLKAVLADSAWVRRVAEIHMAAERSGIKTRGASSGFLTANRETVEVFGQCAVQRAEWSEESSRMEYRHVEVSIAKPGAKSKENQANRSVSPSKDVQQIYSGSLLPVAWSASSGLVPGGALSQLQSGSSLPKFGPLQTRSDSRESSLFPDGSLKSSSSSFTNLVASIDTSQGLPVVIASFLDGALRPPAGGVLSSFGQVEACEDVSGYTNSGKGRIQQGGTCCTESVTNIPNSDEDEGKSFRGSRFQQGTTQATAEGLVIKLGQEASSLKLGIAAGQMFGGSGSSPDLPWVTCTDSEHSGKSICGVLYRYKKGQVKIVCACHGCHMSPNEFLLHAGSVDLPSLETSILARSFTLGSRAACLQL